MQYEWAVGSSGRFWIKQVKERLRRQWLLHVYPQQAASIN